MNPMPGPSSLSFASSALPRPRPNSSPANILRRATEPGSPRPAAGIVSSSTLRPASYWIDHFRTSHVRNWNIPWDNSVQPVVEEPLGITSSIAGFQRSVASEASHYLRLSAEFAQQNRDPEFHEASVLFVREKNLHASFLLRFMNCAAIPARGLVVSDAVFRRVRGFGDLAWSSRVLLVAELVGQEYYPRLRAATAHPALERLCDKLVCDQFAHVRFQIERIARLEAAFLPAQRTLREHLQCAILVGAAIALHRAHGPVLAPMGFVAFSHRLLRRFRRARRAIRTLARPLAPAAARPDPAPGQTA